MAEQRPNKPLTLRILEVPIDTTREQLKVNLESIISSDSGLRDKVTLRLHSLVRRDRMSSCATVTFHASVSKVDLIKRLRQTSLDYPYKFDLDFYGITPVYEDPSGANVE